MFIGRNLEQSKLRFFINNGKAMLVYGLRRIGKTTLINETLKNSNIDFIYFECQKTSEEENVKSFIALLNEKFKETYGEYKSFKEVFSLISKHYKDLCVVIDEYSYLKEYYLLSKKQDSSLKATSLDSEFQFIIDNLLENNKLILCGSSISIMKGLLDYASPLYGRFDEIINLEQFSYLEVKEMFPTLKNKEIVEIVSIFGGSPYVLTKYDPFKTLKDNIVNLILNRDGEIYRHITSNILNELDKDPDLNIVLKSIRNSDKKYGDIENSFSSISSGLLDKLLKKLLDLGIIEKKFPIGNEGNKRKAHYALKDNLLRFYYSYIYQEENRISLLGAKRYFDVYIEKSLKEFISRRFENIVKEYFSLMVKKGKYQEIIEIGSYFASNNEYDCVYQKIDQTYCFYEVKYKIKPLSKGEMLEEIEQINSLKGINISEIGFVCSSGFEEKLDNVSYLDIDDIFDVK